MRMAMIKQKLYIDSEKKQAIVGSRNGPNSNRASICMTNDEILKITICWIQFVSILKWI